MVARACIALVNAARMQCAPLSIKGTGSSIKNFLARRDGALDPNWSIKSSYWRPGGTIYGWRVSPLHVCGNRKLPRVVSRIIKRCSSSNGLQLRTLITSFWTEVNTVNECWIVYVPLRTLIRRTVCVRCRGRASPLQQTGPERRNLVT